MHLVGAGLGHHVHVRARVTAEAGVIGGRLNLELLNGVRVGNRDTGVQACVPSVVIAGRVVDLHTVHLIVVLFRRRAVDAHVLRSPPEARAVGDITGHAGRHAQHLREVPRRERQCRDPAARDRGAQRGRGGLDGLDIGFNGHLFGLSAHFQGAVERHGFGNGQRDRAHLGALESLRGITNPVRSRLKQRNRVDPVAAGGHSTAAVGSGVRSRHGDVRYHGARRVRNGSSQSGGTAGLRHQGRNPRQ